MLPTPIDADEATGEPDRAEPSATVSGDSSAKVPAKSPAEMPTARSSPKGTQSPSDGPRSVSSWGECAVVITLLILPIAVIISAGSPTIVSLWGFISPGIDGSRSTPYLYPVWTYFGEATRPFGSLPQSIRIWPLVIVFHLLAAGSAIIGAVVGREDRRVTGGLLVLAAIASLWVALGVAGRFGVGTVDSTGLVIPIGAVVTGLTTVVVYGTDLRHIVR